MESENKQNRRRRRASRRQESKMRSRTSSAPVEETTRQTRREQKRKQKEEKRKLKKPRRRIFPIWLRIIIIALGCVGALVAGVMVGYGIIGEGVPSDALKKETWQHIIDIVTKKE